MSFQLWKIESDDLLGLLYIDTHLLGVRISADVSIYIRKESTGGMVNMFVSNLNLSCLSVSPWTNNILAYKWQWHHACFDKQHCIILSEIYNLCQTFILICQPLLLFFQEELKGIFIQFFEKFERVVRFFLLFGKGVVPIIMLHNWLVPCWSANCLRWPDSCITQVCIHLMSFQVFDPFSLQWDESVYRISLRGVR